MAKTNNAPIEDNNLKVCVDLDDKYHQPLRELYGLLSALKEREDNVRNEDYERILNNNTVAEQTLLDAIDIMEFNKLLIANKGTQNKLLELALVRNKMWTNGKILTVKFLGGSNHLQQKVIQYAKVWEKYAHIEFNFVENQDAIIRVAFAQGIGSWSLVGTDNLIETDQTIPTMNFGWFDDQTPEIEFSRTITHEFGHALGCIHEHQSPPTDIAWNRQAVYDYYQKTQGWDKAKVDLNVLQKYNQNDITNSQFDRNSIMLYPIPRSFTTDGYSVGWNNVLSQTDIDFIGQCYPKPTE